MFRRPSLNGFCPSTSRRNGRSSALRLSSMHWMQSHLSFPDTDVEGSRDEEQWRQWRTSKRGKRVLLATIQDDSTIVYYFIHDGIVKPRQN